MLALPHILPKQKKLQNVATFLIFTFPPSFYEPWKLNENMGQGGSFISGGCSLKICIPKGKRLAGIKKTFTFELCRCL